MFRVAARVLGGHTVTFPVTTTTMSSDDDDRPDSDTMTFLPVDWTSLVTPETRIHLLHGGSADDMSVYQCMAHLQQTWDAGLVMCRTPAHLTELAETTARIPKQTRLVVCVPLSAIAHVPERYDFLSAQPNVTVVVSVPIMTLKGEPFSHRAKIVCVVLPSCRVDIDNVHIVQRVYSFPATGASTLEDAVQVLPNGLGLAWSAGGRSSEPSFVSFVDPCRGSMAKIFDAQSACDRAWFWSKDTSMIPVLTKMPAAPKTVVFEKQAPFQPAREMYLECLGPACIRFVTSQTPAMLERSRSDGSLGAMVFSGHVVGAGDEVYPFGVSLNSTMHELVPNPLFVADRDMPEDAYLLKLTCTCTFESAVRVPAVPGAAPAPGVSTPAPSTSWKSDFTQVPPMVPFHARPRGPPPPLVPNPTSTKLPRPSTPPLRAASRHHSHPYPYPHPHPLDYDLEDVGQ